MNHYLHHRIITFIVTIMTIAMKMNLTDSYNEHQQKVSQRPEVQSRQVRFNLVCRNHFETKEWFDDNDDKLHSMMMMMIMQMMKMMILTWWVSLLIEPPLMNWKWRIFPTCHHHHYANMSHICTCHMMNYKWPFFRTCNHDMSWWELSDRPWW